MRFLAIASRPWMGSIKTLGVIPRVLADDLMAFCTWARAAFNAALALLLAHEYFLAIRGLVKTEKTWAPANDLMGRELLRLLRFAGSDKPCMIIPEHRDLGGHIDTALRGTGATLTGRANRTTDEFN